jgi:phenylacetic acid degradation operon negative regulatory protein
VIQSRNEERPLTARSVIASTLLGMSPPRLSGNVLVRSGELFGISEGTTRTALSRMLAAGELEPDDGAYRLAGHLLDRQIRQDESRTARVQPWDGTWTGALVTEGRRSAASRTRLREAARALRLAERREGVWVRPDNLDPERLPESRAVVAAQCDLITFTPTDPSADVVAAALWDLPAWAARAADLRTRMATVVDDLEAGDRDALAPGFVLSAAVLRHTQADPLLPADLLPPDWPGSALRAEYDRYDAAFKALWRDWYRSVRSAG